MAETEVAATVATPGIAPDGAAGADAEHRERLTSGRANRVAAESLEIPALEFANRAAVAVVFYGVGGWSAFVVGPSVVGRAGWCVALPSFAAVFDRSW